MSSSAALASYTSGTGFDFSSGILPYSVITSLLIIFSDNSCETQLSGEDRSLLLYS